MLFCIPSGLRPTRQALYCTVLYCAVLYCTVLCCAVLYCAVLYCAVLYCTVLCCTVLYCAVLYCTVLCCVVLYCTVLCCAVLCCTVLYCTVLCCTVLCCTGQTKQIHTHQDVTEMHKRFVNFVRPLVACSLSGLFHIISHLRQKYLNKPFPKCFIPRTKLKFSMLPSCAEIRQFPQQRNSIPIVARTGC